MTMTYPSKLIFPVKPFLRPAYLPFLFIFLLFGLGARASMLLIPMDAESQENHLKAYGITYWVLTRQQKVQWLLNYRGGSFLLPDGEQIRGECRIRGVSFEVLSDAEAQAILDEIPCRNLSWRTNAVAMTATIENR